MHSFMCSYGGACLSSFTVYIVPLKFLSTPGLCVITALICVCREAIINFERKLFLA